MPLNYSSKNHLPFNLLFYSFLSPFFSFRSLTHLLVRACLGSNTYSPSLLHPLQPPVRWRVLLSLLAPHDLHSAATESEERHVKERKIVNEEREGIVEHRRNNSLRNDGDRI
jgi:hypothetical protein